VWKIVSVIRVYGRRAAAGSRVGSRRRPRHVNGLLTRVTNYPDIDEARADAERLAAERG
jgi:hypothetical protein